MERAFPKRKFPIENFRIFLQMENAPGLSSLAPGGGKMRDPGNEVGRGERAACPGRRVPDGT